ncbi:hypothetical protein ScPMuIL_016686 [Solemya velum]
MSSDSSTSSSRTDIFKEKTFCVVVGASRGIGKSIAVNFASSLNKIHFFCCWPEKVNVAGFTQAVIVHNAGTIGDPTKYVREMTDVDKVKHCYDMNVTGMILLNAAFLHEKWLTKAARYMFFRVLAVEEPDIRVLNYDPGLVLTDMLRQAGETKDPGFRAYCEEILLGGKAISTNCSVNKLIEILQKNGFETGAHTCPLVERYKVGQHSCH